MFVLILAAITQILINSPLLKRWAHWAVRTIGSDIFPQRNSIYYSRYCIHIFASDTFSYLVVNTLVKKSLIILSNILSITNNLMLKFLLLACWLLLIGIRFAPMEAKLNLQKSFINEDENEDLEERRSR